MKEQNNILNILASKLCKFKMIKYLLFIKEAETGDSIAIEKSQMKWKTLNIIYVDEEYIDYFLKSV